MSNPALNFSDYEKAKIFFRALDNPHRKAILQLLEKSSFAKNVTDIYTALQWEQSVASQHLAILRKAKIVFTERDGKEIYYRINNEQLSMANRISRQILDTL